MPPLDVSELDLQDSGVHRHANSRMVGSRCRSTCMMRGPRFSCCHRPLRARECCMLYQLAAQRGAPPRPAGTYSARDSACTTRSSSGRTTASSARAPSQVCAAHRGSAPPPTPADSPVLPDELLLTSHTSGTPCSPAVHVQPAVHVPEPHRQGGLQAGAHEALGGHQHLALARVLQAG